MSVVWEVEHLITEQRRAVKVVSEDAQDELEAGVRLVREARLLARLQSRHVVRVLDVDHHGESAYVVMELLEGTDLARELDVRGRFTVAQAVDDVLQICGALAEAHDRGIVHRDIKPANMFRAINSGRPVVKLLDFGVGRDVRDRGPRLTLPTLTVGTTAYSAPEQRTSERADARSDVFSLGLALLELVTGDIFIDSPAAAVLPSALLAIIQKMIAWCVADRPQSILEAADALVTFAPRGSLGRVAAGVAASRFGSRHGG
jgi:serine/threonine-protein kinase